MALNGLSTRARRAGACRPRWKPQRRAPTGSGPDVLSIDPGLGWLYVGAESGNLTVFDIGQPGVALVGHDSPGNNSHSVAVDPATHRVFFPLTAGPQGTPVLRVMRPTGV